MKLKILAAAFLTSISLVAQADTMTEFDVLIEIPMNADPIKYEVDEELGAMRVDRIMLTPMFYPYNYGFIPNTLSEDGDPLDVLVKTPYPIQSGSVIKVRTIGILEMEDESGIDAKLIGVPVDKIYPSYSSIETIDDLDELDRAQLMHFFENYKDLEEGKWVKITGWNTAEVADKEVQSSIERFNNK